jgi:hypothetical protein
MVPLEHAVGKLQLPPMLQHPAKVPERAKTELVSQLTVSTAAGGGGERLEREMVIGVVV